jgi:hypothetical protein
MRDTDMVQLKVYGRNVDFSQMSNPAQDVIVRLKLFERQGIAPMTVADLGYELKIPAIKQVLAPLIRDRYITTEEVYPPKNSVVGALQAAARDGDRKLGLGVTTWRCPVCGTGNISPNSDPKHVVCHICGKSSTVTGRNIDNTLIVQPFNVR